MKRLLSDGRELTLKVEVRNGQAWVVATIDGAPEEARTGLREITSPKEIGGHLYSHCLGNILIRADEAKALNSALAAPQEIPLGEQRRRLVAILDSARRGAAEAREKAFGAGDVAIPRCEEGGSPRAALAAFDREHPEVRATEIAAAIAEPLRLGRAGL